MIIIGWISWCSQTMWKQGSIVRCDKNVYQACGHLNAAEPGLVHHKRFYVIWTIHNQSVLHFDNLSKTDQVLNI